MWVWQLSWRGVASDMGAHDHVNSRILTVSCIICLLLVGFGIGFAGIFGGGLLAYPGGGRGFGHFALWRHCRSCPCKGVGAVACVSIRVSVIVCGGWSECYGVGRGTLRCRNPSVGVELSLASDAVSHGRAVMWSWLCVCVCFGGRTYCGYTPMQVCRRRVGVAAVVARVQAWSVARAVACAGRGGCRGGRGRGAGWCVRGLAIHGLV